ncbi:MAG: tRNA dihydrouridine synthase DusB [bacterium]
MMVKPVGDKTMPSSGVRSFSHGVKIGGKVFKSNIFLSPLSGVSDIAFRMMCREGGAGMAFFEMVSANAVVRGQRKTMTFLKTIKKDRPTACQILGCDPDIMNEAAHTVLEESDAEFIDINAACPVRKVISAGSGAALLKKPEILFGIVKKISSSVPTPVTVKLRVGFDRVDIAKIVRIAKGCEDAGAAALFVHGRTRKQMYGGEVDYEAIRKVKGIAGIPVFGSGNIFSHHLAEKMFKETGCDGIFVARGAFGNPCIFTDIKNYLKSGMPPEKRTVTQKIVLLKKHLSYIEKYSEKSPAGKTGFMKKAALWYLKDFPGSARARAEVSSAESVEQLLKIIDEFKTKFFT